MIRSGGARREGAARVCKGAVLPLASALALFCQVTHVSPPKLLKWRMFMLCSSVGAVGHTCTTRRCSTCVLCSALRRVPSRAIGCWGATRHRGDERRRVWREYLYHALLRWHVEYNVSVCACAAGRRRSAAPGATAPRAAVECMPPGSIERRHAAGAHLRRFSVAASCAQCALHVSDLRFRRHSSRSSAKVRCRATDMA